MSYPPYQQPYGAPPIQPQYGQPQYQYGQPQYDQSQYGQPPYDPNQPPPMQPQGQWGAPLASPPLGYVAARSHSPMPPNPQYPPQPYPPQQQYPSQQYGQAPGYPPQPPPQWGQSPQLSFPPPPQAHGYSAPLPSSFPPPPPHAAPMAGPGQGGPPPMSGYPPQQPPRGYQQPGYGATPPVQYAQQPQGLYHDPVQDVAALQRALKAKGGKELIAVLANRDSREIDEIRRAFRTQHGRDLIADIKSQTTTNFELSCVSTALGPVDSEAYWVYKSTKGIGTRESVLTEAIFGRTNSEILQMKQVYQTTYHKSLESAVRGDLSMKTEQLFEIGISGTKMEEWHQPDMISVQRDMGAIYSATVAKIGTDEMTVCQILAKSNSAHLRAVVSEFQVAYKKDLRSVIVSEFSSHMKNVLLYILDGAVNKVERDAKLLEESMKGIGTKDTLLISRLVRIHWDKQHLADVNMAYSRMYGKDLIHRIRGETSGDYRLMLIALASSA